MAMFGFLELLVFIGLIFGIVALIKVARSGREPFQGALKPILIFSGVLMAICLFGVSLRMFRMSYALILIAVVLFVLIGLPIAMLSNPKTRPWGIGLLVTFAAGIALLIPFGLLAFFWAYDEAVPTVEMPATAVQISDRREPITEKVEDLPLFLPDSDIQPDKKESETAPESAGDSASSATEVPAVDPTAKSEEDKKTEADEKIPTSSKKQTKRQNPKADTKVKAKAEVNTPKPPRKKIKRTTKKPRSTKTTKKNSSPSKRPDWVDSESDKVGDAYHMVVHIGPYTSRIECEKNLNRKLERAAGDYLALYRGMDSRRRYYRVRLPIDYVRNSVVRETWVETKMSSVGPMKHMYALLVFDRKTNDYINQLQHKGDVEERLLYAGMGLTCVLFVLFAAYGVLKIDIITKGDFRWYLSCVGIALVIGFIYGAIMLDAPTDGDKMGVFTIAVCLLGFPGVYFTIKKKTRALGIAMLTALVGGSLMALG